MTTTQIVMINNSLIQDYMYIHPDDHYSTFLLWNLNTLTKRNFCFEVYLTTAYFASEHSPVINDICSDIQISTRYFKNDTAVVKTFAVLNLKLKSLFPCQNPSKINNSEN